MNVTVGLGLGLDFTVALVIFNWVGPQMFPNKLDIIKVISLIKDRVDLVVCGLFIGDPVFMLDF